MYIKCDFFSQNKLQLSLMVIVPHYTTTCINDRSSVRNVDIFPISHSRRLLTSRPLIYFVGPWRMIPNAPAISLNWLSFLLRSRCNCFKKIHNKTRNARGTPCDFQPLRNWRWCFVKFWIVVENCALSMVRIWAFVRMEKIVWLWNFYCLCRLIGA